MTDPKEMAPDGYIRPTYSQIRAKLMDMSRDPFRDALALLMSCTPDQETLMAFASDSPDKWAHTVRAFAQLSGYHDKLDVDANLMVSIQQMGDAQLIEALKGVLPMIAGLRAESDSVTILEGEAVTPDEKDVV